MLANVFLQSKEQSGKERKWLCRKDVMRYLGLSTFGINRYQIPQPANNKRALEEKDLMKILSYKPEEGTWEDYAKDMWMLSLLPRYESERYCKHSLQRFGG